MPLKAIFAIFAAACVTEVTEYRFTPVETVRLNAEQCKGGNDIFSFLSLNKPQKNGDKLFCTSREKQNAFMGS